MLDAVIVDVEMGDDAYLRQVTDRQTHVRRVEVRLERGQTFALDLDEDHVGVLAGDPQTGQIGEAGGQTRGAGMVVGEAGDVMVERMQTCGGEQAGLTPAPATDLAPAPRAQ